MYSIVLAAIQCTATKCHSVVYGVVADDSGIVEDTARKCTT